MQTSLDAEHINEVHINFPGDSPRWMMLPIDTLPGRTALDYVTHITQHLNAVTDTYALCSDIDPVQLHAATVTKVKSTLSDSAVVNHCVRVQLEQRLNIELLELNCNVHPLDGLASEARKTLKKVDAKYEIKRTLSRYPRRKGRCVWAGPGSQS